MYSCPSFLQSTQQPGSVDVHLFLAATVTLVNYLARMSCSLGERFVWAVHWEQLPPGVCEIAEEVALILPLIIKVFLQMRISEIILGQITDHVFTADVVHVPQSHVKIS